VRTAFRERFRDELETSALYINYSFEEIQLYDYHFFCEKSLAKHTKANQQIKFSEVLCARSGLLATSPK